ncbi:hypothetical protein JIG36_28465 [Actinoplanes sp. LDG1-06]|uniref:Uncharacterized protein n=1 Tax=Paractinoplanes ovalisporus TaxID=2810368 RepID=A0ABS2AI26_9ACTN|nr:hypothetical protein [Actinoplanes ovalisporus]MBM2619494.1 hypothetical protein [Actinoplanes ovalisporus]
MADDARVNGGPERTMTYHVPFTRIAVGSVLLRLEPFTSADITAWLDVWNRVNHVRIASGWMNAVEPAAVTRHPTLAEQPLLLLMLASCSGRGTSARRGRARRKGLRGRARALSLRSRRAGG